MADYLTSLVWGLAILGALAGWGRLAAFFLERTPSRNSAASWLESPALGIATCAFFGGILNLFSLAGARTVAASVIAGDTLLLIAALRARSRCCTRKAEPYAPKPAFIAILTMVLCLLAIRFSSSVIVDSFYPNAARSKGIHLNVQDDFHSYLVSIERMLQTGSIGLDPFNSRQIMSALGADHILNSMMVCLLPYDNAHLLEGGVGLAAACLAAAALGLRWNLSAMPATALMLIPLLVDLSFVNISSTMTSSAVLIALIPAISGLATPGKPQLIAILRASLLLSGACALKTTTIPPACAFIAIEAVCLAIHTRCFRPITVGLLTGFVAAVFLLPWMIWQFHNGGTALYPLLGVGFQSSAYAAHIPFQYIPGYNTEILLPNLILPSGLLAVTLVALIFPGTRAEAFSARGISVAAFLIAWTLSLVVIGEKTQAPEIDRYVASARLAGLIAFIAFVWRLGCLLKPEKSRYLHLAGPLALVATIAGLFPEWETTYFSIVPANFIAETSTPFLLWNINFKALRAMQAATPPGEKLLVYVDRPFLLDFRRNTVYVADWPGETSPPPGMPNFLGGEAVADYLLKQGIRYLAYSYYAEADFPRRVYKNYASLAYGSFTRRCALESFAFQDDVVQLQHSRHALYDDGELVLLDLATPAKSPGTK